jgi:site-specific recombinase XerD
LAADLWPYIEAAVDLWPQRTLQQRRGQARARWVLTLAVKTGLRASEIAQARASDIQLSPRQPGKFTLHLVRKGGVESALPLLPSVMDAYREYLRSYELPSPQPVNLPLILPLRNKDLTQNISNPSRSHIWLVVKDVLRAAADVAMERGDEPAQMRLRLASTHWLRHTFATDLLDQGADLVSVRDLLDHASIATTSRYLHRPEDRLREDLERLDEKP